MPIYEYECIKCGHVAEVWQKITDSEPTKCEACKGKMRKLISQSSFHLKGSGWYVTNYKSRRESDKKKSSLDTKPETKTAEDKPKKEASSGSTKSTDE
jgi:putative FmdB family regulatory protein